MATEGHKHLADFIKSIHQDLRKQANILGPENAWKNHCKNTETLQKYAASMKELAVQHWECNSNESTEVVKCRIRWVYNYCMQYFFNGDLEKQRSREYDIANRINLNINKMETNTSTNCYVLKLLDVGSCYNPFKEFDCFDILPIDIAPASEDVYVCDFLNVKLVNYNIDQFKSNTEILELPMNTFDVIVFSLVLGYLPCPRQRQLCCANAYKLLKLEGLLIIITPDSNHVGANAKFMKSWRYNLAKIGFSRVKYEKLSHIHCMAFRKCLKLEITHRWTELQKEKDFFTELLIPQDFNNKCDQDISVKNVEPNEEINLAFFNELPNFEY